MSKMSAREMLLDIALLSLLSLLLAIFLARCSCQQPQMEKMPASHAFKYHEFR